MLFCFTCQPLSVCSSVMFCFARKVDINCISSLFVRLFSCLCCLLSCCIRYVSSLCLYVGLVVLVVFCLVSFGIVKVDNNCISYLSVGLFSCLCCPLCLVAFIVRKVECDMFLLCLSVCSVVLVVFRLVAYVV